MKVTDDNRRYLERCPPIIVAIANGFARRLEKFYKLQVEIIVNQWDGIPPFPALKVRGRGKGHGEIYFYAQAISVSSYKDQYSMPRSHGLLEYEDPQLERKIIELAALYMGARRARRKLR